MPNCSNSIVATFAGYVHGPSSLHHLVGTATIPTRDCPALVDGWELKEVETGRPPNHERHDPGVTGGAQRPWWSSLRPGRSLLLFPLAVALCWGIVIAVFASIG